MREAEEGKTPLQERLVQLSKLISLIAVITSTLIVILGVIQKRDFSEIFLTAIAVAVAAVPEGLAVAVTVILVLGMKQILAQKASSAFPTHQVQKEMALVLPCHSPQRLFSPIRGYPILGDKLWRALTNMPP